jgi:hypothetical protein
MADVSAFDDGITFSLIERFNHGVFPSPHQFTDREIANIAQWAGDDEKGTFGGYGHAPGYASIDDKIIDEYGLDVSAGENTWPRFAAMLKEKKETWSAQKTMPCESEISTKDRYETRQ